MKSFSKKVTGAIITAILIDSGAACAVTLTAPANAADIPAHTVFAPPHGVAPVKNLTVTASQHKINVTWNGVNYANDYKVQLALRADFSDKTNYDVKTATKAILDNKVDTSRYTYYVRVVAYSRFLAPSYSQVKIVGKNGVSNLPTPTPAPTKTATPVPTKTSTPTPTPTVTSTPPTTINAGPLATSITGGKTLGTGIYTLNGFTNGNSGSVFSGTLNGQGVNRTIIVLNKNSMTQNAPTTQNSTGVASPTNPYYILNTTTSNSSISNLTVEGTDQGYIAKGNKSKCYNGLHLGTGSNLSVSNVKIEGVPGWSNQNPGETFAIGTNRTDNVTMGNVEIDGQNNGGSGVGLNNSAGATLNNVYAHDLKYGNGIALWQLTGAITINNYHSKHNHSGISIERINGTVNMNNPNFEGDVTHDVNIGNDTGHTKLNFYYTSAPTRNVVISGIGGKEQGNPSLETKNDIHLYVNGVDESGKYITW